jgi:hypothetical protein
MSDPYAILITTNKGQTMTYTIGQQIIGDCPCDGDKHYLTVTDSTETGTVVCQDCEVSAPLYI